jgi:hypothetical protein
MARVTETLRLRGVLTALALAAPVSCVIVTGSTDGYELAPAPATQVTADAGAADIQLDCLAAANCSGDGGDGVCCLDLAASGTARAACQAGPCGGVVPVQLCAAGAECAGGTCVLQTCPLGGSVVDLRACGLLPTCKAR